jgi:hypothetical protein
LFRRVAAEALSAGRSHHSLASAETAIAGLPKHERRRRAIVEALGYVGADAHAHLPTARASLLRLAEIKHFPLTGQIVAARPAAVASSPPHHLGTRDFGRRSRHGFLSRSAEVEKGRTLEALRAPAEGPTHQVLDVGLLLIDGRPQLRDGREQLGDHLFEDAGIVRQVR